MFDLFLRKISRQKIYAATFFSSFLISLFDHKVKLARDELELWLFKFISLRPIFLGRARVGLFLAAKLSHEKKKGVCLISPLTILDVANMIAASGAPVEYYDLRSGLYECDVDKLSKRIDQGDVAQFVITHYFYIQRDFDKIQALCREKNIALIEDCAISLGARYNGQNVGTFGDFSVFSFSLFKFLNNFWGGALFCKSDADRRLVESSVFNWRRLNYFEYFPQIIKYIKFGIVTVRPFFGFIFYIFRFGLKNNIPLIKNNIQNDPFVPYSAAIENNCMTQPHNSFFIELNNKKSKIYSDMDLRQTKALQLYLGLRSLGVCSIPENLNFSESTFINFPLYFSSETLRDLVADVLLDHGIDCSKQLYRNISSLDGFNLIPGLVPNVIELVSRSLFIPIHKDVETDRLNVVIDIIKGVVKR